MKAITLSIGQELVTGAIVDSNAAWLAQQLTDLGFQVRHAGCVGDDREAVADVLRTAMRSASVVVATGGLGPTADDVTREALADALGVALTHNPDAESQIRAFYDRLRRNMPRTTMRQAQVPHGCEVIPNPWGTAPGIMHRSADGSCRLFVLPGVPVEMKNMFAASVEPELSSAGAARTVRRILRTFGMTEAAVGEAIEDLMAPERNPRVGITVHEAVVSVRINATALTGEVASRMATADADEIHRRLAEAVFGEGQTTLADAVGALLMERGQTVATAESCTGGLLAKLLTDVPGASAYMVRGYVAYSNEAKINLLGVHSPVLAEHGAVSEPVAAAMAEACLSASNSTFALSITGIAGPTGGSAEKPVGLVVFGLADKNEVQTKEVRFGSHLSREQIRERAAQTALNLLRLRLLKGFPFQTRVQRGSERS